MRKLFVFCLLVALVVSGTTQAKAANVEVEWLKQKEFHPANENAATSRLAFADLLNQTIGYSDEEKEILNLSEELGYWLEEEEEGDADSAIKHGEAVKMLTYFFPYQTWNEDPAQSNEPVKWGEAITYIQSLADTVFTSGTYTNETVEGSALITQSDVTIENVTIKGDLLLTKGASNAVLNNTKVEGNVYIEASIQNTVKFVESDINQAIVYTFGQEATDWTLVWNDEFLTEEIDSDKWTYDIGNWIVDEDGNGVAPGWGNNEQEYYTDSPENSYIEDGNLVIKAKKEKKTDQFGSYDYTSAKLKTKGLFSKKYGKFEARMKLPEGQGYWPAFWMMPEDSVYGNWPVSGEIDIMEAAGNDTSTIGGTIHYGEEWPNNTYTGEEYHFPEGENYTDYHTYSIEWEPGEIRWYVDGELYQTLNKWFSKGTNEAANYTFPAPFDQEFYMILNLAVGGWYGGDVDETTEFPGQMEVDYVRVYELTGRDYMEPVEPTVDIEPLPEDAKQPLEDGNLIYDQSYENGFTIVDENSDTMDNTYWNFLTLPDFQGQGSISTDEVNGTTFAKTEITNQGNALWALQLIQKLSIGEGRTYKVSFDAKSDANRTLMTKVSGGAERGYANYSGEKTMELTDEVQSYEYTFTHNQDTDLAARLEFNLGQTSTNPVWIGNVRVEDITGQVDESNQKEPLADGNHVYNGTFDQGDFSRLVYWETVTQNGAEAESYVTEEERFMHMNIEDVGSDKEDIQFKQNGLQFLKGSTYDLTFRAKADQDREMSVSFVNEDGSMVYQEAEVVSLGSEWNTYTVSFEMTKELSDLDGQLIFNMGGTAVNVYMDDVRLDQTSSYVDYSEIDLSPLKNGDFSEGMDPWTNYIHFDANATIEVKDEALSVDITNAGNETWSVLPEYAGLDLIKGLKYELSFDAKSSVPREIEVTLENAGYYRYLSEKVSLSEEYNTFTYQFEMTADDKVSLKYLMGQFAEAHSIEIDNVSLEVVIPEDAN
ncbi:licheninase [Pontibacillus chungwhensis BH030062]|uniref:Licheninase n=1 Tax=Pontibacillus chungwhensis BH030062 TaxID=1385513 RepID=A0A0A2UWD9_9BACI|nr:carbohydrate binding domain-containing protein [Pontibacillus chungwhensis]KGP91078.1 licheninase [Pontibacillus chungwhensis BH030062]